MSQTYYTDPDAAVRRSKFLLEDLKARSLMHLTKKVLDTPNMSLVLGTDDAADADVAQSIALFESSLNSRNDTAHILPCDEAALPYSSNVTKHMLFLKKYKIRKFGFLERVS